MVFYHKFSYGQIPKAIPNIGKLLPLLDKPVCDCHILFQVCFIDCLPFPHPFFKEIDNFSFGCFESSPTQEMQSIQWYTGMQCLCLTFENIN